MSDQQQERARPAVEWINVRRFTAATGDGDFALDLTRMKAPEHLEPRFSLRLIKVVNGKERGFFRPAATIEDLDTDSPHVGIVNEASIVARLWDEMTEYVKAELQAWVFERQKFAAERKAAGAAKRKRHEDNLARRRLEDQERSRRSGSGTGGGKGGK